MRLKVVNWAALCTGMLVAFLLDPHRVNAQTLSNESLSIACTAPTKNADGSAIASTAALAFKVYGAPQGTTPVLLTPTPVTACAFTATQVPYGNACYVVSAVETIPGLPGVESAQTAPICETVSAPTPAPPTGVSVTVAVPGTANTVYVLEKSSDQLVMLPAGTVPAGTTCDTTQATTVNGGAYNVVPHASVTWTGTVKSLVAFAKCS
jgi:hypothetical protein